MAVAMMPRDRESWSDDRLDDLNHKFDEGFKDMREEFRAQRTEFRDEFGSVRSEIGGVRSEIGGVRSEVGGLRSEISATNRLLAQVSWAMFGTTVVGFLSVIATILATN